MRAKQGGVPIIVIILLVGWSGWGILLHKDIKAGRASWQHPNPPVSYTNDVNVFTDK